LTTQASARARELGDDIQRIAGTSLDKGVEMDALASHSVITAVFSPLLHMLSPSCSLEEINHRCNIRTPATGVWKNGLLEDVSRDRLPDDGGLALNASSDPKSSPAWKKGAL